jgi:solute carrier family 25 citrate transporter 1
MAAEKKKDDPYKTIRTTIGGALGGGLEALCLHPVDTIKTRLHLFHLTKYRLQLQTTKKGEIPKYKGTIHCAQTIIKEEGGKALYKGLLPFVTHLMTKYALRYFTYSSVTRLFKDEKGQVFPNSPF